MKRHPEIPRIDTTDALPAILAEGRPVVFSGGGQGWRALTAWTPEYLRRRIGGKKVRSYGPDGQERRVLMSDYIDHVWSRPASSEILRAHLGDLQILKDGRSDEVMGALLEDFEILPAFRAAMQSSGRGTVQYWLQAGPYKSQMHFEGPASDNLNVQITGEKRIWLFPPDEVRHLHVPRLVERPHDHMNCTGSPCGMDEQKDATRYPGFQDAQGLETVLRPGEMIYIPAFWYHLVQGQSEVNQNVNFWWPPDHLRLSAASLRWAFINMVVKVLGRLGPEDSVAGVAAAIRDLPDPTRHLLAELEMATESPQVISGIEWARQHANVLGTRRHQSTTPGVECGTMPERTQ